MLGGDFNFGGHDCCEIFYYLICVSTDPAMGFIKAYRAMPQKSEILGNTVCFKFPRTVITCKVINRPDDEHGLF